MYLPSEQGSRRVLGKALYNCWLCRLRFNPWFLSNNSTHNCWWWHCQDYFRKHFLTRPLQRKVIIYRHPESPVRMIASTIFLYIRPRTRNFKSWFQDVPQSSWILHGRTLWDFLFFSFLFFSFFWHSFWGSHWDPCVSTWCETTWCACVGACMGACGHDTCMCPCVDECMRGWVLMSIYKYVGVCACLCMRVRTF